MFDRVFTSSYESGAEEALSRILTLRNFLSVSEGRIAFILFTSSSPAVSTRNMTHQTKVSLMFALFVGILTIALRSAIAVELLSPHQAYHLVKCLGAAVLFITVCYLAYKMYAFFYKMSRLPGPNWRMYFDFVCSILSDRSRRGMTIQVNGSETFSSLNLIRFNGEGGDLMVPFSWMLPVVFVQSFEATKQVFNHPLITWKGPQYWYMKFVIGDGLVTSSGHTWASHRKLLTPAFHMKILESLMSIIVPQTEQLIMKLEQESNSRDDRCIENVTPFVCDCVMNVLLKSSMGLDTTDESNNTFIKVGLLDTVSMVAMCMVNPFRVFDCILGVSKLGRKFKTFKKALEKFVDGVISQRMAVLKERAVSNSAEGEHSSNKQREPFIDILIHEHLKNPSTFTVKKMRDEINTFSLAGVDTAVWSISYTLLLLGHHEHVQEKLYEEISQVLSDNDFDQLTTEMISKLPYLNAVYNESLRLYPPAPIMGRAAEQDITIGDKVVPRGAQLLLNIRALQRDARYWPDPHRFKPDRFLSSSSVSHAFFPFAAGPRNCVGQKYAKIVSKAIIMRILQEYRIRSITQLDEILTFSGPLLHTETPIKLQLDRRHANNN